MAKRYEPISSKLPHLFHGGDYNPDQWRHMPDILKEDIRLMKLARCNVMSIGIFAWTSLEPEEGVFSFEWLDEVMDDLAHEHIYVILATPTGARPAWMSRNYPEVSRVSPERRRDLHGGRHNHCYTSPVYREKTLIINKKLAERYKNHPALLMWHVSNEYCGECHCDLCQEAFRGWLQRKYEHSISKLNLAWWTSFWNHTFTDWSQIQSPSPHGELLIHGLNCDWKRFVTDQTLEFMKHEIKPLKQITPDIPVTTNFMGTYPGLNYWKFANELDVISWDNYPFWHEDSDDWKTASNTAFIHDLNRSLKRGRPFILMESTPSVTSWRPVPKLKKPGMHLLSSLQAVAHGSDSVQYFQWRKGRGGCEKFHGAVVDHEGTEHTRIFKEVSEVGETLLKLDDIRGTTVPSETAIIFDWENRWALEDMKGPGNDGRRYYEQTCKNHYYPFWARGIPVNIINMDCDFSQYKLVIAPMLYMVRQGFAERCEDFVKQGGSFVTNYLSGIVNENDLCFLGGFPGPLRKLLGIWSEEIECLNPEEKNYIVPLKNNHGLKGEYETRDFCDLIHAESSEVLAVYKDDFYKNKPALTVNYFGKGRAYYIASRNDQRFLMDFYIGLSRECELKHALDTHAGLPEGVTAQIRVDEKKEYIFLLNFTRKKQIVHLGKGVFVDKLSGESITGRTTMMPFEVKILEHTGF
jgi:beta-galactosidase